MSGEAIAFAGVEVAITGQPAAGDKFSIAPSADQDLFQTVQHLIDAFNPPAGSSGTNATLHNAVSRLTDIDQGIDSLNSIVQRLVHDSRGRKSKASQRGFRAAVDRGDLGARISTTPRPSVASIAVDRLAAAQQAVPSVQDLSLFKFL